MKRYEPNINVGLTEEQVKTRISENLANYDTVVPTKTAMQIIASNIFTIFNFLNIALALAILSVSSHKNLLFMGVVVCNVLISTIQELRAKRIIDKLSVFASEKVEVIRDKNIKKVSIDQIVLDDLINLKIGNQIVTDSIIVNGECEVDESFITGESKTIYKEKGDMLLSGSFIVSGSVIARVEHIGLDNYTAKISKEAKYIKKVNSQIMYSLNKILKLISFIIVPLGIILFFKQYDISNDIEASVVNVVAALIGMIPEGLILLTSTVFAIAVLRLAKYDVLVQELYSIEILARIDTLCLDKTGTITEGIMEVKDILIMDKNYNPEEILSNLCHSFKESNSTLKALQQKYERMQNYKVKHIIPFSSAKKYSGICFEDKGTYLIGAPEILIKNTKEIEEYLNKYSDKYRILALVHTTKEIPKNETPSELKLVSLILIEDKIRKEAKEIIKYFNEQDVDIKIISGDSISTVTSIAERSGVKNYDKGIDLSTTKNDNYDELVKEYTLFARVNPDQKKKLILALKKNGKTVAMTGDGVNDVLALKEADCSIGLMTGTEAARNVSDLVLLKSDFSSVVQIIKEGRRSINNIERSSTLFLVKTIFATLLAIIFLFISLPYPFIPIQLTLTSSLTIGIPSLILALEPNHNIVKGKFLTNVISKALPAGLTIVINIMIILTLSQVFNFSTEATSTMCVISNAMIGFLHLYNISKPFNITRKILITVMILLMAIALLFFRDLFSIVFLKPIEVVALLTVLLLSSKFFDLFFRLYTYILKKKPSWFN